MDNSKNMTRLEDLEQYMTLGVIRPLEETDTMLADTWKGDEAAMFLLKDEELAERIRKDAESVRNLAQMMRDGRG